MPLKTPFLGTETTSGAPITSDLMDVKIRQNLEDLAEQIDTLSAQIIAIPLPPPESSGGVTQSEVSAQIDADVFEWAQVGNTDLVPEEKLPESDPDTKGIVALADRNDADAGTSTLRAMTPALTKRVVDASAETGATIKTKLEGLSGTARLDATAVKNLPAADTAAQIKTKLESLQGSARLEASAIQNLPMGGGASPDTAAQIKTKLETLTGEGRLDATAIKNLPPGTNYARGILAFQTEPDDVSAFPLGTVVRVDSPGGWYEVEHDGTQHQHTIRFVPATANGVRGASVITGGSGFESAARGQLQTQEADAMTGGDRLTQATSPIGLIAIEPWQSNPISGTSGQLKIYIKSSLNPPPELNFQAYSGVPAVATRINPPPLLGNTLSRTGTVTRGGVQYSVYQAGLEQSSAVGGGTFGTNFLGTYFEFYENTGLTIPFDIFKEGKDLKLLASDPADVDLAHTPRRVSTPPTENLKGDKWYLTADYISPSGIEITPQEFAGTELDGLGLGDRGWYDKADAGFDLGYITKDQLPSDFILISNTRVYVKRNTQTNLTHIVLGDVEYALTRVPQAAGTKVNPSPDIAASEPDVDYYTITGGLPAGDWDNLRFRIRSAGVFGSRNTAQDFNTLAAAGNTEPRDMWSDGTTLFILDNQDDGIFAYNLQTKSRDQSKEFTPAQLSDVSNPVGIWSDGSTMFVFDLDNDNKLFAYNLQTKARDQSKDITLSESVSGRGMWSNGVTIWFAGRGSSRLKAYNLSSGAYDSSKNIDMTAQLVSTEQPLGVTSDGDTLYATTGSRVHAYNLRTRAYDQSKSLLNSLSNAGNTNAPGLWTDGSILWVSDRIDNKVYAYNIAANVYVPATGTFKAGPYYDDGTDAQPDEYAAPPANPSADLTFQVQESVPGQVNDVALNFLATGTDYHVRNPFDGVFEITYNNTSSDADTYQRYTVRVLRSTNNFKQPIKLKVRGKVYPLTYFETDAEYAVYRTIAITTAADRVTSVGSVANCNVQFDDNSWASHTGILERRRTINKTNLIALAKGVPSVHALPTNPADGTRVRLLNDLSFNNGVIITPQAYSRGIGYVKGTPSTGQVSIVSEKIDEIAAVFGATGTIDDTVSVGRASGTTETPSELLVSPEGISVAQLHALTAVGSPFTHFWKISGTDFDTEDEVRHFWIPGRRYRANVKFTDGTWAWPLTNFSAGDIVAWTGLQWILTSLRPRSDEEIDAVATDRVNAKFTEFNLFKRWVGTQAQYDAIAVKDERTEYLITG